MAELNRNLKINLIAIEESIEKRRKHFEDKLNELTNDHTPSIDQKIIANLHDKRLESVKINESTNVAAKNIVFEYLSKNSLIDKTKPEYSVEFMPQADQYKTLQSENLINFLYRSLVHMHKKIEMNKIITSAGIEITKNKIRNTEILSNCTQLYLNNMNQSPEKIKSLDNEIWILFGGNGSKIIKINANIPDSIEHIFCTNYETITAFDISYLNPNHCFAGTEDGVILYYDSSHSQYPVQKLYTNANEKIIFMAVDENVLYVTDIIGNFFVYDIGLILAAKNIESVDFNLTNDIISSCCKDRNIYWLGTMYKGVYKLNIYDVNASANRNEKIKNTKNFYTIQNIQKSPITDKLLLLANNIAVFLSDSDLNTKLLFSKYVSTPTSIAWSNTYIDVFAIGTHNCNVTLWDIEKDAYAPIAIYQHNQRIIDISFNYNSTKLFFFDSIGAVYCLDIITDLKNTQAKRLQT